MRRYISLLLVSLCVLFVVLATLLYTTQIVGQKNKSDKLIPVIKTLTVYTTIPADMASIIASEYQKENNIQINFIPLSLEELTAKINNREDFSSVDMVMTDSTLLEKMAKMKLLKGNISEQEDMISSKFKADNNEWIGVWYDPVVFCYNLDYVKNNWQIPLTWEELSQKQNIKIAMTDFMVASASLNILYTLAENKTPENTIVLMKNIHPKVVRYTKYLSTPVRMAGMAEADIAIAVQSESIRYINDNYPLSIIYPKDGTAYQLTGIGILENSNEQNEANNFIKWLLGDDVQMVLQANRYYFIPTNYSSLTYKELAKKNINFLDSNIKLDENNKKELLDKWVTEIRLND